jgi:hypothetical protein
VKLTTHLQQVPRSETSGAIPPLPQHAFKAWCSVKTQRQLYFLEEEEENDDDDDDDDDKGKVVPVLFFN